MQWFISSKNMFGMKTLIPCFSNNVYKSCIALSKNPKMCVFFLIYIASSRYPEINNF